jgi:hypothetical protein
MDVHVPAWILHKGPTLAASWVNRPQITSNLPADG